MSSCHQDRQLKSRRGGPTHLGLLQHIQSRSFSTVPGTPNVGQATSNASLRVPTLPAGWVRAWAEPGAASG